jgi:hypothetical protein
MVRATLSVERWYWLFSRKRDGIDLLNQGIRNQKHPPSLWFSLLVCITLSSPLYPRPSHQLCNQVNWGSVPRLHHAFCSGTQTLEKRNIIIHIEPCWSSMLIITSTRNLSLWMCCKASRDHPFLMKMHTEGSDTATLAGASQYDCGYRLGYQVWNQFVGEGQEVQYKKYILVVVFPFLQFKLT